MDIWVKINSKKKVVLITLSCIVLAAFSIFAGYFYVHQAALNKEEQSLTATGTIQATTVMASFKIPGKINQELVDEGSRVTKGQEIASLEDQEINSDVIAAQGAYSAALGQAAEAANSLPLTSQQAEAAVSQAQAGVAQAQIGVNNAKQQLDRVSALFQAGAVSKKDFEDATDAYNLAQAKYDQAQGALNQATSARLNVRVVQSKQSAAQGVVEQANGAVQKAQAYLNNTHLLSPIDGFITKKYLELGEMLNAGTPVFEITDLANTYVKVYISEAKIGRVQLNQEAQVKVDTYPDRVFTGKVVFVNTAGDFAVQKALNDQYEHDIRSYEVKISVPNSDLALKTGMTAKVKLLEEAQ